MTTNQTRTVITAEIAKKVLEVVDHGLSRGMGIPELGKMCIEAAVTYALGEVFSDEPSCVTPSIRHCKIGLNDNSIWEREGRPIAETNLIRAEALRRIAIAQLGTKGVVSGDDFDKGVREFVASELESSDRNEKLKAAAIAEAEQFIADVKNNKRSSVSLSFNPVHTSIVADRIRKDTVRPNVFDTLEPENLDEAKRLVEGIVQVLIKLGSPGAEFLYLTETPATPAS